MTDGAQGFSTATHDFDGDELVFDGPEIEPVIASAPPPPAPEPAPRKIARAAKAKKPEAPAPTAPPPAADHSGQGSAAAGEAAIKAEAEQQRSTAAVSAAASDRRALVTAVAAAAIAAFAAVLAVVGLLIADRTLREAAVSLQDARARQAAFASAPAQIARLDAIVAREESRIAAFDRMGNGTPVTTDELKRELDALRGALAARQPDGMVQLHAMTQAGLSELATRLDRIETRLPPVRAGGDAGTR